MRKNPRSVDLPPLTKKISTVYFDNLTNLLYKGQIHRASNRQSAYELCSSLIP